MGDITLESLIDEHKNRMPQLKYEPDPPDCFGFSYYYYEDEVAYEKWLATTKRIISNQFPGDKDIAEFEAISKEDIDDKQQGRLLAILEAFKSVPTIVRRNSDIQTIEKKGKEKDAINVNTIINNAQSQAQSQSISIFIEAIKDELTGKQQKELEALAKEVLAEPEKRTKIIDKLKSFGLGTLSNIIANIATNPTIWG